MLIDIGGVFVNFLREAFMLIDTGGVFVDC